MPQFTRRLLLVLALVLAVAGWRFAKSPDWLPPVPPPLALAHARSGADPILASATVDRPDARLPARAPDASAHRGSAAQRISDREQRRSDLDLAAVELELRRRALTGDADAAMSLSQLHEYCHAAAIFTEGVVDMDALWQLYREGAGVTDAELAQLQEEVRSAPQRCGTLIARGPDALEEMAQAWRRHASQLGHPAARLREHAVDQRIDYTPAQQAAVDLAARTAAIELLRDDGPAALAHHQDWLAHVSPYSRTALAMAACQITPACVANPVHFELEQADLRTLQGSEGAWTGWLHSSPRELEVARAQSDEIVHWWRAGQFEQIVPGRPAQPPGGP